MENSTVVCDTSSFIKNVAGALEEGNNVLLHSPGGCGKTYLAREIAAYLVSRNIHVYCTATTGVAATNLSYPQHSISGLTLHSWAHIGVGDETVDELVTKIRAHTSSLKRWTETEILIIDEISMMGRKLFEKLDAIARKLRCKHFRIATRTPIGANLKITEDHRSEEFFGGIKLLVCGDFLQLPPVKDGWIFESSAWRDASFITVTLQDPKRYDDVTWFYRLLRFRWGTQTQSDIDFLFSRVKAYEKLKPKLERNETLVRPTILYSKRIDVQAHNDEELNKLPHSATIFSAVDQFTAKSAFAKRETYFRPLDDTIPSTIILKKGAQVMLRANLDVGAGLVNGSRGVVIDLSPAGAYVKWVDGSSTMVTYYTWEQKDKEGTATRTQIPLILAWSLTIHRTQGATLDYVICDLGQSIFLPGQAYVALSRVRSSFGLFISSLYPPMIKTDQDALEFVRQFEKEPPIKVKVVAELVFIEAQ